MSLKDHFDNLQKLSIGEHPLRNVKKIEFDRHDLMELMNLVNMELFRHKDISKKFLLKIEKLRRLSDKVMALLYFEFKGEDLK